MTALTFDAKDPHTINDATHRRDWFAFCEEKLGRMSVWDPRRKTLDSSWGKPAGDQVTQGNPKPAPKAQPESVPQNNVDPLRPDEIAKLKHLLARIEPAAPAPTMADKARQDSAAAIQASRKGDPKLPEHKKPKKEATHDAAEPTTYQRLGHHLYS